MEQAGDKEGADGKVEVTYSVLQETLQDVELCIGVAAPSSATVAFKLLELASLVRRGKVDDEAKLVPQHVKALVACLVSLFPSWMSLTTAPQHLACSSRAVPANLWQYHCPALFSLQKLK
jgi:hypothetical protein